MANAVAAPAERPNFTCSITTPINGHTIASNAISTTMKIAISTAAAPRSLLITASARWRCE